MSVKNKLRDGVLLVKERLLHPERFIRGSSEKAMRWTPEWDRGKPLSPKERIAARLQLVVWLKELEHELIRETIADGEELLAAREAKKEIRRSCRLRRACCVSWTSSVGSCWTRQR